MSQGKGTKNMTEKEYLKIKKLLEAGVPRKYVKTLTSRGDFVISNIDKAFDFTEYKRVNYERQSRWHRKNLAQQIDPVKQQETPSGTIIGTMKKIETSQANIERLLNQLLKVFEDKEAYANVAFWKR